MMICPLCGEASLVFVQGCRVEYPKFGVKVDGVVGLVCSSCPAASDVRAADRILSDFPNVSLDTLWSPRHVRASVMRGLERSLRPAPRMRNGES